MSQLIDQLEKMGMDRKKTMERFMGDEEFYFSCYKEALEDPRFEQLGEQLKEKQVKESFDSAHTLKGVISQIGLTSLFQRIEEIVEPLRKGNIDHLEEAYQRMLAERDRYLKLIE